MKKKTTIAIVAAIALATGALGLVDQADAAGHKGKDNRPNHSQFMENKLSLTAAQKLQMKEIRDKWRADNEKLERETSWELKDYRYDLSAGRKVAPEKVADLKAKMVELEVKRMELQRAGYAILDSDQKKLAEVMMKDGPRKGDRREGRRQDKGDRMRSEGPGKEGRPMDKDKRDEMRAGNREQMQAMRDDMHKLMTGNPSESELKAMAEKRVDQRLEMISKRGDARYEMRTNCSPQNGRGQKKTKGNW